MSAKILDGKIIAVELLQAVKSEISSRTEHGISAPVLAVILLGDAYASALYVKHKMSACAEIGIGCKFFHLINHTTEQELLELIDSLNNNDMINGILVQLPLPNHFDIKKIFCAIKLQKDVDGFHPHNIGLLAQGWPVLEPCTPKGVMKLLAITGVDLIGKKATVVGSSNIVGKPMSLCLINAGCTVTICNSSTVNLSEIVKTADILVVAAGAAKLIKGDWVKEGSIVIDVGINKIADRIMGDVDFDEVKLRAGWITKVPGGVGPMTIACLMENILLTQKLQAVFCNSGS